MLWDGSNRTATSAGAAVGRGRAVSSAVWPHTVELHASRPGENEPARIQVGTLRS